MSKPSSTEACDAPSTSKEDNTQSKVETKKKEVDVKNVSDGLKKAKTVKKKSKRPVSRNKQYSLDFGSSVVEENLVAWLREMGKQNGVS